MVDRYWTPIIAARGGLVEHRPINPTGWSYALAHEITVPTVTRVLYISGQVPEDENGQVPAGFGDQCRLAWANVEAQLRAAGMTLDHLVKVTVFLADREHRQENYRVRQEVLGDRSPALTIIITGIYDERWLLEIEGIAAA
jgi:2-iminobutanoate/2-iminopropanoate deaminase